MDKVATLISELKKLAAEGQVSGRMGHITVGRRPGPQVKSRPETVSAGGARGFKQGPTVMGASAHYNRFDDNI